MADFYLPKDLASNSNGNTGRLVAPTPEALYVPLVFERTSYGDEAYDVFSRLMRERIIFVGTAIDDDVANTVLAQLLFLDYQDPGKDIFMYINSPGGSITAGLAIYDAMQFVQSDVSTICMGLAASMATILLCAGAKGKRYALPNSTIHQHPALISGGMQGSAPDIEIQGRYLLSLQDKMRQIMVKHTGQPYERISKDFDRDNYMSPTKAMEYGFIDEIMSRSEVGKTSAS